MFSAPANLAAAASEWRLSGGGGGVPCWFTPVGRLPAAAFPGLAVSSLGVMCILLPCLAHHDFLFSSCNVFQIRFFLSLSQHSGPGFNHLTCTCALLSSSFLSAAFPLTVILSSPHPAFSSTAHLVQRLPSCIQSRSSARKLPSLPRPSVSLAAGPHSSQGNVLTASIQCCNIWLIQSTLSNLHLIIWVFCLRAAKHLD